MQQVVGQDYVIMWRQKASDAVFPDDVETIRRELQTLSGHPDRLHARTRAAIEMAEKVRLERSRGPRLP